jgi:cytoskeleton protein RodZ
MLSVGETLKRARLEQGLDLGTVAAQTKISAKYLEAIESNDHQMLPSGFFYRSFVEQYAKYLSLDTREIDAEVDRVLSADDPLPLPGFESVVSRNVQPLTSAHRFHTRRSYTSVATLVLVIGSCSGVYAWWHEARSLSLKAIRDVVVDNVRAFTKSKTVAVSAEVDQQVPKPTVASPPRQSAPQQELAQPAPKSVSVAPDAKPIEADNSTLASPAALSDDRGPAETSDYKVMLDLMAREATWLSVSSDGKPVFSGILRPNQTKTVGSKQFAKMRVGNAAGIDVRLNGRLLGPLGARGQVLNVLFTPDNFQIISPPKESD